MSVINNLSNSASVLFNSVPVVSNTVSTLLSLPPTILKAVDKLTASIGDTITYTITITNVSLSAITNLPFTDIIPIGCTYISDSFTVNGTTHTPTITAQTLTYTIPSISALGVAVVVFQGTVVGGSI